MIHAIRYLDKRPSARVANFNGDPLAALPTPPETILGLYWDSCGGFINPGVDITAEQKTMSSIIGLSAFPQARGSVAVEVPPLSCFSDPDPTPALRYLDCRYALGFVHVFSVFEPRVRHQDTKINFDLDEQFGGNGRAWSDRYWLGAALEAKKTESTLYDTHRATREFENGKVLIWLFGMGSSNLSIDPGSAGIGYHWERLSGSQQPLVNDGSTVSGAITVDCYQALYLRRVAN